MSRGRGDRTERLWVPVLLLLSSLKVRTASLPDRNQQSHTNNPASRSTTMSVTLLNACAVRAEDATSTVDGALLLVHFFPRCTVGAPTAAVVLRSMPQRLHAMADSAGSGNESKVTETTIGGVLVDVIDFVDFAVAVLKGNPRWCSALVGNSRTARSSPAWAKLTQMMAGPRIVSGRACGCSRSVYGTASRWQCLPTTLMTAVTRGLRRSLESTPTFRDGAPPELEDEPQPYL